MESSRPLVLGCEKPQVCRDDGSGGVAKRQAAQAVVPLRELRAIGVDRQVGP